MKFKTTNSLIEKQRLYWDEDFYMPGDEISEVFEISTEEIINEDLEVLSSYAKSKEGSNICSKVKLETLSFSFKVSFKFLGVFFAIKSPLLIIPKKLLSARAV